MKFRTDKDILQFLGMGLGIVALGVVLLAFFHAKAGIIFIVSGTFTVLIGLSLASKPKDFILENERSLRINEKAGNYALWAVMTVILGMYILRVARFWDPDFMDVYSMVFFTGIYGYIIMRWHLNKKNIN
ncbi:MAG: hypothetical protein OIN86_17885 [Candidatus Methanoperedens sp.]|nr:hypothetical protein [Candidatus Methanoperedens sp.]CAG0953178.1 hypothetical protein METP1_00304 [Methanosarcinales archaeon]